MPNELDELKKSEAGRENNSAKPLGSSPPSEGRIVYRRRRTAFSLILVSCMLIVILIMGFGLWWSQQDIQRSSGDVPGDQSSPADPAAVGSAPQAAAGRSSEAKPKPE